VLPGAAEIVGFKRENGLHALVFMKAVLAKRRKEVDSKIARGVPSVLVAASLI